MYLHKKLLPQTQIIGLVQSYFATHKYCILIGGLH